VRVLDLFAGLGGWSAPFKAAGDEVITLDFNPDFNCDITADILTWDWTELVDWQPTLVLASPPCETFSVMSIGTHWDGAVRPRCGDQGGVGVMEPIQDDRQGNIYDLKELHDENVRLTKVVEAAREIHVESFIDYNGTNVHVEYGRYQKLREALAALDGDG
jgi:site-specific DNA-cytosine methylase